MTSLLRWRKTGTLFLLPNRLKALPQLFLQTAILEPARDIRRLLQRKNRLPRGGLLIVRKRPVDGERFFAFLRADKFLRLVLLDEEVCDGRIGIETMRGPFVKVAESDSTRPPLFAGILIGHREMPVPAFYWF